MQRLPKTAKKQCKSASANSFLSLRRKQVISAYKRSEKRSTEMICCGPCQHWGLINTLSHSSYIWVNTERLCVGINQKSIRRQVEPLDPVRPQQARRILWELFQADFHNHHKCGRPILIRIRMTKLNDELLGDVSLHVRGDIGKRRKTEEACASPNL